ncbi:MAG TPA: hypothetical protein VIT43_02560 [Candidatus Dormibacteraeota bacterium]
MRHLSDGTLRRIYDEPLALSATDQQHFDGCAECKARFDGIANAARSTDALLTTPAFEPAATVAFASLQQRMRRDAARPVPWYQRWVDRTAPRLQLMRTPAVAVVLAAALLTGVAGSALAIHFLEVFKPNKVVAVEVSPSDFAAAAVALDYGQEKWLPSPPTPVVLSDPASAQTQSGLPVLTPASLPAGVTGQPTYAVVAQTTGSLTFDASRLRASAAQHHVKLTPMPSSIDGSTLIVNAGPALLEVWGVSPTGTSQQLPTLVIAQTKVPTIESTGATPKQLEQYVLSQSAVPADLRSQVLAIADPSTTLPIPIPKGLATTENVQVNGVQGVLIKAVLGAGVVWIKNGVIYAVGGQLTPDQVLALARTLG